MDNVTQAGPSFVETMADILARHVAEVEDEGKRDRAAFDCIRDGRAWIETFEQANSAARLMVEAERKLEAAVALMRAKVARAQARVERLAFIFHGPLKEWTQQQLTGKKKRSMILDDAMLQLRKLAAKTITESEATLTAWAERECVDAITYKPVVSIEKVKEWEDANKQLAPGRRAQDASETLKVKIPKMEDETDGDQG